MSKVIGLGGGACAAGLLAQGEWLPASRNGMRNVVLGRKHLPVSRSPARAGFRHLAISIADDCWNTGGVAQTNSSLHEVVPSVSTSAGQASRSAAPYLLSDEALQLPRPEQNIARRLGTHLKTLSHAHEGKWDLPSLTAGFTP